MNDSTTGKGDVLLGVYEITRPLGQGGMGRVFLGRHRPTGRPVVVKVMHDHLAQDPRARQDFEREVRMMKRFRHPHAVALLDAALDGMDQPCLIMEYVPGINLEEYLDAKRRLTPVHAGRLLGQLAPVLQAAHDRGILHRDLTLANLMVIGPGTPGETLKVLDFGLARASGFYLSLERLRGEGGGVCGTPDYICPESIRGDAVDQRGDLYSVGVALFKLLTGRVPFEEAQEIDDILDAHLKKAAPRFAAVGIRDVPAAIEAVVQRCLNKFPQERYGSARELAEAYQAALGKPIVAEKDFAPAEPDGPDDDRPAFDPDAVVDRFEAWMPEQVAVMKLRGFVDGVGGQVVDSNPGLIRVALPDPAALVRAPERSGLWSWIKPAPKVEPERMLLDLHLEKRVEGTRNLVELTVVRPPKPGEGAAQAAARQDTCQQVCRELRAYLMIGR